MPAKQTTNWIFTRNLTDDEMKAGVDTPPEPIFDGEHMKFLAYELERGGQTGRPHWQGYLSLKTPWTKKKLNDYFNKKYWLDEMRGRFQDNEKYCGKEGRLVKHGTCPKENQGKRKDIDCCVESLLANETTLDELIEGGHASTVARAFNMMRYLEAKRQKKYCAKDWQTKIVWLHGPTGCGKSKYVRQKHKQGLYIKPLGEGDLKWWDNYEGEEYVLMDDFRGQIAYAELLTLADWGEKTLSRRGTAPSQSRIRTIYITSCDHPRKIYHRQVGKTDSINQLMRRIEKVYTFIEGQTEPVEDNSPADLSTLLEIEEPLRAWRNDE